jgi:SAM-dependent methyltransferase
VACVANGAPDGEPAPRHGPGILSASLEAPGKDELVARGFALAGLRPGARVLDVGCGRGTSVDLARRSLGLRAVGLDLSLAPDDRAGIPRLRADAAHLPVGDGMLDAVLLECVLSSLPDREAVLRECARALAPSGKLVLTDLHALEGPSQAGAHGAAGVCGAGLLSRETILGLLASSGFEVLRWEDHSGVLKEYLLRLIMGAGGDGPWSAADCPRGGGAADPGWGRIRPGYCLLVGARRGGPDGSHPSPG